MVAEKRRATPDPVRNLVAALLLLVGVVFLLLEHWVEGFLGKAVHDLGIVLVATIVITFLFESVLRKQHAEYVVRVVQDSLVPLGTEYGLAGIERRLGFEELFEDLKPGDELLWLDTYCPDQPRFQDALVEALERGASVRMLAVDPDSDIADMRAREIRREFGFNPAQFKKAARAQIESLQAVLDDASVEARSRIKLRLYDDLPCAPMYIRLKRVTRRSTLRRVPCEAFTTFFLREPTFSQPHLKWVESTDGFVERFTDYFDAKWSDHERHEQSLTTQEATATRD